MDKILRPKHIVIYNMIKLSSYLEKYFDIKQPEHTIKFAVLSTIKYSKHAKQCFHSDENNFLANWSKFPYF